MKLIKKLFKLKNVLTISNPHKIKIEYIDGI